MSDTRQRLGSILLARGWVTPQQLAEALSEQFDVPFYDLDAHGLDPELARAIPEEVARSIRAIALKKQDGLVLIAVDDPTDDAAFRTARALIGARAAQRIVLPDALRRAIDSAWEVPREVAAVGRADHRPEDWARAVAPDSVPDAPDRAGVVGEAAPLAPADRAADRESGEVDLLSVTETSEPAEGPSLSAVRRLRPPLAPPRRDLQPATTLVLPKADGVALAKLASGIATGGSGDVSEQLLAGLIARGVSWEASRVELLATGEGLQVRYRIDGEWQAGLKLPAAASNRVLAALDRLAPPGGDPVLAQSVAHLPAQWEGRQVDLRIVTQERAELRRTRIHIVDPATTRDLEALGAPLDVQRRMRQWTAGRQGLVLVAGPPESGRTTTLRALARHTAASRRTVLVERASSGPIDGVVTIARDDEGLPLGSAIDRAIAAAARVLIVDGIDDHPDTIRLVALADAEMLVILGVEGIAADDAIDGMRRRGVPDALLGESLIGIVEHRLVRLVCPKCSSVGPIDTRLGARLGLVLETMSPSVRLEGPGCPACHHTGYRGRRAVFTKVELPGGIRAGASAGDVAVRVAHGRDRTAGEEAASLLAQGRTTLREVSRALGVRTSAPIVSVQSPRYVDGMAGETVDGVFGDWDREEISLDELPAGGVRDADDTRLVVIAVGAKDRGAAVLAAALPPAEFRVVRARSLDEAWELVSAEHPAALAVDTCGDARAGLATLAALRGTKATAFLPLLVLDDVGVDAMDALRAGADDVLPKGAPPHEIEQALREALSRAT